MSSKQDPVQNLLDRLGGVKANGDQKWQARCPAHEDSKASLSVTRGEDGRALVYCHAGCTVQGICDALGMTAAELFPTNKERQGKLTIVAVYQYRDEQGNVLYESVRYTPKNFKQRQPDGKGKHVWNLKGVRRILYRLPELLAADPSAVVFLVEGEKDVERLAAAGLVATCNVGGAGKWKAEYNESLRGRSVVVIADRDGPEKNHVGERHARGVCTSLMGVAASVKYLELPGEGVKDASDWFAAGGSAGQLMELVGRTPSFEPARASTDGKGEQDRSPSLENDKDDDAGHGGKKLSQAKILVMLGEEAELWHDGETAYATVEVDGHRENHPIKGNGFRSWLARAFWRAVRKVAGSQAMQDALGVLAAKALYEGEQRTAAVRVAEYQGAVYLDLANNDWQFVKVTAEGFQVISDPPVMFIRRRGMMPLPVPVAGGSVNELRPFINVKDDRDFVLVIGWIVSTLRGRGPYPVQAVYGEQGSCKSTAQKMQRALVDPNKSPLRSEPKEARDLMITAANSLVVGFDNLSSIPTWLSDAMCRLSTGGGFATRELYSDADEIIFDAMRPQMFNGITDVATRPDLMDRAVLITLTPIGESDRKPEEEVWKGFNEARPRILGALLTAVAAGLANLASVKLDRMPRMADFAKWVTACEPGLGWKPGTFMEAYAGNRADANESAIESSVIGPGIVKLIDEGRTFAGTSKELKDRLESLLPHDKHGNAKLPATWPKSPKAFAGELRRIAPNLRPAGIAVSFGKHTRKGTPITLERKGETSSPSSPPSPASEVKDLRADGARDDGRGGPASSSPTPSPPKCCAGNGRDERDDGDGQTPSHSEATRKVVRL